ncbi:MAG: MBL fold metallo-hydrolase [Phycisphaerales bacterium]|nr:MBL fold metallo-hydrolase [Phycisphaerales bacterium]
MNNRRNEVGGGGGDRGGDRPKVSLTRRAQLWRAGLKSSFGRYSREIIRVPPSSLPSPPDDPHAHDPLCARWDRLASISGLAGVAWLGHCSTLLKIDGLTILTDPVLSLQVGLRLGLVTIGPRRLLPVLPIADLPRIDLILISHAHFDHLDRPTLKRLADRGTRVITAGATARHIPSGFAKVDELRWGERTHIGPLSISALRPEHWGARMAWDRHRGFNSYLLESQSGQRVFFAGDTAMTDAFDAHGPVELAIMGIGAYNPWEHFHATPEQALAMARAMNARMLLPVHHSTFKLSDEPLDEPMQRLLAAADGGPERVLKLRLGEVFHHDAGEPTSPARSEPGPT